jgi:Rrf2 family iron-sulfur cluster assembly transcriptional regulator
MKLTTKSRYAVMAMVDLASQASAAGPDADPVLLATLASNQDLSIAYLEQLFAKLAKAGLVIGQRGPRGGYRLTKNPDAITVADIVGAVSEETRATRCAHINKGGAHIEKQGCLPGGRLCLTHDLWAGLTDHIADFLGNITLQDVLDRKIRPHSHQTNSNQVRAA